MSFSPDFFLAALAVLGTFAKSATAQYSNASAYENCSVAIRDIVNQRDVFGDFNSSGTTASTMGHSADDWYVSVGISDSRHGLVTYDGYPTGQQVNVFLSVPESLIGSQRGNDTLYCPYRFQSQNVSSSAGSGEETCSGVLSDRCLEALRSAAGPREDGCPRIDVADDRDGMSTEQWTLAPRNFSDGTCALGVLPRVSLPDGYQSYSADVGRLLFPADRNLTEFDAYDLRVRQAVPILITSRMVGSEETHVAMTCTSPDEVSSGSREPDADFPPSASSTLRSGKVALWAFLTAFTLAMLLA
ncbi:hypothetical protein Cob_v011397 [Colletotrichum orbiculare MAFF 240422]|uniref:Uncharacterized protein n=1 Tax=Colletotrichum orbiculare (strain 104-T / ATCC 96160 / CBS 514.97 / LARS 414 / MAFF 240422) TaxID=1213857 RepID=N4UZG1_COLOR|nr:hypothetical protein Cob_v011397 [Colletotrichum orbiculare MAFF 240422]